MRVQLTAYDDRRLTVTLADTDTGLRERHERLRPLDALRLLSAVLYQCWDEDVTVHASARAGEVLADALDEDER